MLRFSASQMPAKVRGNWCNLIIAQPMALSDARVHIAGEGWSATLIEHRESNLVLRFRVRAARALARVQGKVVHRFWSEGRRGPYCPSIFRRLYMSRLCERWCNFNEIFETRYCDVFKINGSCKLLGFFRLVTDKKKLYDSSFFLRGYLARIMRQIF